MDKINLAVQALYWCKRYHYSNPEIGMGPFLSSLLDRILEEAGVELTPAEKEQVVTQVRARALAVGDKWW